ncbi:MAG: alpha/beta fold hydrolase [Promethearchaeota archaeon]|nr:MAG: alpha/beta fold hydrolase [Candidatus Lokiarchaeota archaeon]
MPKAKANNIEIEYETFGDPLSKPLLLIMGLGAQMIRWDEEMCQKLAESGFYVIRFDNRDVGLSTKFDEAGEPDLMKLFMAYQKGEKIEAPYTLNDMADDAVGLLDALSIEKAHICGASMGGMIAQVIAYRHPSRVLSLTSIMSSTGNPDLPRPKPEALQVLLKPVPEGRDAIIEEGVNRLRIIHGSGFPFDEKKARELVEASYDRSNYRPGYARQLVATLATGNRKTALSSIKVPTLVIHGSNDPLMPPEGGKDTAETIPGSELLIIEGMGHSLPPEVWPEVFEAFMKNASKAGQ